MDEFVDRALDPDSVPRMSRPAQYSVTVQEVAIPLSDGVVLSGRVWLPHGAGPVPAVLEYLPYRKSRLDRHRRLGRAIRTSPAAATPACASTSAAAATPRACWPTSTSRRSRRTRSSCSRWIAAQQWCDGHRDDGHLVGRVQQPPDGRPAAAGAQGDHHACSTDDRYADDVHYMGGSVLGYYMLPWASVMLAYNARRRIRWWWAIAGARCGWSGWRRRVPRGEMAPAISAAMPTGSRARCARTTPPSSARLRWSAGGSDGYTNAIFRMLEGLSCPRRAVIGPWEHVWPEQGVPGPAIGFLQEEIRWWDHWLKGVDTGIMDEPLVRA